MQIRTSTTLSKPSTTKSERERESDREKGKKDTKKRKT